jgi:hypothetical protein
MELAMPLDARVPANDPSCDHALQAALARPQISLIGDLTGVMLGRMLDQFDALPDDDGPVVLDLTTNGGEADTARRMALEIRLRRERLGRRLVFLGKTNVYSAGMTVMSAFPRQDRWLTRDCRLLIHERHMETKLEVCLPLGAMRQTLTELLATVDVGIDLEKEGFRALVEGSTLSEDELCRRASSNYYLSAEEALRLGLVEGLV